MTPAARSLAMHTCSCFTKRGRILLFSPVFLSTRQIKACRQDLNSSNAEIHWWLKDEHKCKTQCLFNWTHCDLHFLYAGVDVEDGIIAGTNYWFVLNDHNLK